MRGCVIFLAEAPVGNQPWKTGTTINLQLLDWYSKKHTRVVRSTYAAELLSLLDCVNQGHVLKLCWEEVINGAQTAAQLLKKNQCLSIPLDAGVDARSVFDSVTAQTVKTPSDKQLMLHARAFRELLEDGTVDVLYWFDTEDMLRDGMTKGSIYRRPLLALGYDGTWAISHDNPVHKTLTNDADEIPAVCAKTKRQERSA